LLRQVRPLVVANRALASGDLTARAPVLGRDELGELADGVNQMATALQESHETLEERVRERTAEVERLLRERTDFFTAVSHEFRTPLAVILGHAELLADPSFEKKATWHAQAGRLVGDAAQQLLEFVNDIVDIARAEAGRVDLDVQDVRADVVLRDLRPTIAALAASGDVTASVKTPRQLPAVRADEPRLRQVILDLVDNAVKYTPAGGKVAVRASAVGDAVEIAVSDTGIGIAADDGDRLFEPFYRARGSHTQKGQSSSGLGLALVKGLVEAQHGTVRFESVQGKGSTFTISFPIASNDESVA
jgi:signal transduction histidine kinase